MVIIVPRVAPGNTGVGAAVEVAAQAATRPPVPPVATAGGGRGPDRNGAREALDRPVEREERDQIKTTMDQKMETKKEARKRDVKITMVS